MSSAHRNRARSRRQSQRERPSSGSPFLEPNTLYVIHITRCLSYNSAHPHEVSTFSFPLIFSKVSPIAGVRLRGVLYGFVQRSLGIRHGLALFLGVWRDEESPPVSARGRGDGVLRRVKRPIECGPSGIGCVLNPFVSVPSGVSK